MKGNFHVRFLGGCGRGNPPALTRSFPFSARTRKEKEVEWGGPLPRAAAWAALPWATLLLPLRGAGRGLRSWRQLVPARRLPSCVKR